MIRLFIFATLLGMLLAHEICAQMRREWPDREPSPNRVATLVLGWLRELVTSLGTRRHREVVESFVFALWREGANSNPGRPYMARQYAQEIHRGG